MRGWTEVDSVVPTAMLLPMNRSLFGFFDYPLRKQPNDLPIPLGAQGVLGLLLRNWRLGWAGIVRGETVWPISRISFD